MSNALILNDYNLLKDEIVRLAQAGKARARAAVAQETLRRYHGIGGVLHAHALAHRGRADYGAQVIVRLAEDVGLSKTLLYQTLSFYRLNPIFHACGKLTWTHYRALLGASAAEAQRYYEGAVIRAGWSVRELAAQVRTGTFAGTQQEAEGTPRRQAAQLETDGTDVVSSPQSPVRPGSVVFCAVAICVATGVEGRH